MPSLNNSEKKSRKPDRRIKLTLTDKENANLDRLSKQLKRPRSKIVKAGWHYQQMIMPGVMMLCQKKFENIANMAKSNWHNHRLNEYSDHNTEIGAKIIASIFIYHIYVTVNDGEDILIKFAQIDENSLPEISSILAKLTADNLAKKLMIMSKKIDEFSLVYPLPTNEMFHQTLREFLDDDADLNKIIDVIQMNIKD